MSKRFVIRAKKKWRRRFYRYFGVIKNLCRLMLINLQ